MARAVEAAGRRAYVVPADLMDLEAVADLADQAFEEFGRLDIVVNNVGGTIPNALLDTDPAYLEEAFHFNVSTAHALTRAAVPQMLKNDGGSIVNISSVVGRVAGRGYLAYGTAKAALAHYTRLAAQDLSPTIRVNAIAVGSVMTSALEFVASDEATMTEMTSKTPLGRVGEVEDISAAVLYLSSPAGGFVTGKVLEIDGGLQMPNLDLRLPDLEAGEGSERRRYPTKRVVAWSTGTVGRHAIAGIDARPDLELVGVWVSSDEKVGKDAGELAGLGRELGVVATNDKEALFALEPDCIVHTAMVDDRIFEAIADLTEMVERGINVVSSGPVLLCYPQGLGLDEFVDAIDDAGAKTGASLHVNGIDPGWANDVLPLALTSLSQRIDLVRVSEIADYSTYYQPVVMRDIYGFGKPMDDVAMLWQPGILTTAWGPVVRQIAAGLDLTLDPELEEIVERVPAERDLETVSVDIAEGTMGAVRFQVVGKVDGVPRVILDHVTRTHVDQMPEWPQPPEGGGCYRVEVEGEPMMRIDFTHHGEDGDHNVSGMIVTAMRLVNAVHAVCDAPAGLVVAKDLPPVTGRGW